MRRREVSLYAAIDLSEDMLAIVEMRIRNFFTQNNEPLRIKAVLAINEVLKQAFNITVM